MVAKSINWFELTQDVASLSRNDCFARNDGRVTGQVAMEPAVTGVEYDSRRVTAGSVFVAMHGGSTDGNRYIQAALSAGALGIVTDSAGAFAQLSAEHSQVPVLLVEHGRAALAQLSAAFFGHPELSLQATGATGTNGKTTTAFLIEALLMAASRKTVLVGTIEYHVAGAVRPSEHTTPESRDLFALMAEGVEQGATELVMEVSSHALDQGRVAGVGFDVAVFTNLTRDHLDYHGTMEEYFAAKRLLFDGTRYQAPRVAILNAGDAYASQLAQVATGVGSQVVNYGIASGQEVKLDWRAEEIRLTPAGAEFLLVTPEKNAQIKSALAGEVNVLNLLAALAAAHARGVPFEVLVAAVPTLRPVTGAFSAGGCGAAVYGDRGLCAH